MKKKLQRLLFGFFLFSLWQVNQAEAAWFNNDWAYRIQITSDFNDIPTTQSDIPLYVDLSILPSDFFSNVKNDGSDIVVTLADEITEVDREVVNLNTTTNTGEIHFKAPNVSGSAGTDFYIYYGNTTTSKINSPNVWSDYRAVWHLDEPFTTTSNLSTGILSKVAEDGGDGSWPVLFGASPATSQINIAVDEDQFTDTERNHTLEQVAFWVFNQNTITNIIDINSNIIGEFGVASNVGTSITSVGLQNTYTNPVVITTYNLPSASDAPAVVRVGDISGNNLNIYLQNPGGATPRVPTSGDVHYIVMESGNFSLPDGTSVEAGISNITGVNNSSNWNQNQLNNITPVNTYSNPVVLGQVQTNNESNWQAFWATDGTDRNNPPTAGNIFIGRHTGAQNIGVLAAEDLGYIILESGDGVFGTTQWFSGVSLDAIAGVDDAPPYQITTSGGALAGGLIDSTINNFNADFRGGISPQQTGAIGRSVELDGNLNSYLPIGGLSYTGNNSLSELTASFWLNTLATGRSGILDFDRSEHWEIGMNFHNAGSSSGRISFDTANQSDGIQDLNSTSTINNGDWHHVVVVYEDGALEDKKIYIDGVLDSSVDQHSAPLGNATTRFGFIGEGSEASSYDSSRNNLPYEGLIDEVRIQHTAKDANWILTEYNNQNDNAGFWSASVQQSQNNAPIAPTSLFFNHTSAQTGLANPINIPVYGTSGLIPYFSAIYKDLDIGDIANQAQIQVSTDPTFGTITHWDSGMTALASNINESNRSIDIEYGNFGSTPTQPLAMSDGNITYYWRIAFSDIGGLTGAFSSPATFSVLDLPVGINNIAASIVPDIPDTFTINWQDITTNETSFEIQRRDDTGGGFGAWSDIANSPVGTNITTVNDTTTANNSAYQYQARACNYAGCSAYLADPFTHFTDPEAPAPVYGDSISDTEFDVYFTDRSILDNIEIDRCDGISNCTAGTFSSTGNVDTTTLKTQALNDTGGIASNEIYRWRARANNGTTNSQYTIAPYEYTSPNAPSDIEAVYSSDNILNLTWSDNSDHEDGFRILISENGGTFSEITPGTNTVGANITTFTYTGASANNSYDFIIRSHIGNTLHNSELFSTDGFSNTVYTTPTAPTIVSTIYNSDNDIDVNWADNSNHETAFNIYVSENGGAYTLISTEPANTSTFNYTAGNNDNQYSFRVESVVNMAAPGNLSDLLSISIPSAPVIYTTPASPILNVSNVGPTTIDWGITDNSTYEEGYTFFLSDGTTPLQQLGVPNITSWTETGLGPNQLIERQLGSYIQNNGVLLFSPLTAISSVYTLANAPNNIVLDTTSLESLTLSWDADGNPIGTEFFVTNLRTNDTFGWSTNTTWNNTGLTCGLSYSFELKSRNNDLVESFAEVVEFSTAPCPISGGSSSNTGSSSNPIIYACNPIQQACTQMYPTKKGDDDLIYQEYTNCKLSTSALLCAIEWAEKSGYSSCTSDEACKTKVSTPISPIENIIAEALKKEEQITEECEHIQLDRKPENRKKGINNMLPDVDMKNPFTPFAIDLAEQEVIHGDQNTTRGRLEDFITRAEIAKIISISREDKIKTNPCLKNEFSDVEWASWYHPYVQNLHEKDILHGYSNGLYRPDRAISKAEFMKIIALGFEFMTQEEALEQQELNQMEWYQPFQNQLSLQGLNFSSILQKDPQDLLTRGEVFKYLSELLAILDNQENYESTFED